MFSDDKFNASNTALGYVNTVVTLLGVIWAAWTASWHLGVQHATKHLGPVCRDEDLMGFFVVKAPRWWWAIFPFLGMPRVSVPVVPNVSALIEAGDDGIFTSSMFNSILPDRRKVSWNAVYERFFIEHAWNLLRPAMQGVELLRPESLFVPKELLQYQKRAEEAVWVEVRRADDKYPVSITKVMSYLYKHFRLFKNANTGDLSISRDRIPFVDRHLLYYRWNIHKGRKEWWQRNVKDESEDDSLPNELVGPMLIKCQLKLTKPGTDVVYNLPEAIQTTNETKITETKITETNDITETKDITEANDITEIKDITETNDIIETNGITKTSDIAETNAIPVSFKESNDSQFPDDVENAPSVMLQCFAPINDAVNRPGDKIKPDSGIIAALRGIVRSKPPGNVLAWTKNLQKVWIHNDAPCIEVSEAEIGALALAMGVTLKINDKDSLPSGPSAFGASITSSNDGSMTKLKFSFGFWHQNWYWAGSGYQTLFAKFIACGCLPFARDTTRLQYFEEYGVQTEVVHAVEITPDVFDGIRNGDHISAGERGCSYSSKASAYLDRLPSSAICYVYDQRIQTEDGYHGLIQRSNGEYVGSWVTAVTRIAFGGLVPMATKPLIKAVQFTVGRGNAIDEGDALETLISFVMEQTKQAVGNNSLRLFGINREIDDEMNKNNNKVDLCAILRKPQPLRYIVEVLVRYNTLLERLMAMMATVHPGEQPTDLLQQVFHKCQGDIYKSYNTAREEYKKKKSMERSEGKVPIEIEKLPREVEKTKEEENPLEHLRKILSGEIPPPDQSKHPTIEDCALVALYIIKAWTNVVKVVDWGDHVKDKTGDDKNSGLQSDEKSTSEVDGDEYSDIPKGGNKAISNEADEVYKPIPFSMLPDVALWE